MKEAKGTGIAKPVPSRPKFSTFRSFPDLLAGAINASLSSESSESPVRVFKPKSVRFKPMLNNAPVGMVSSQNGQTRAATSYSSDKILNPGCKSTAVYKPLAKLASRTNISLLDTQGKSTSSHQQDGTQVKACAKFPNEVEHHFKSADKTIKASQLLLDNLEDSQKSLLSASNRDRPFNDGYNWRKYGQKQVKGCEYPRSYYKCTHPNCPVKKKAERSMDGRITEIIYKGEHNHSKPRPPRRSISGEQGQGFIPDETGQDTQQSNMNWSLEGRIEENYDEVGLSSSLSTHMDKTPPFDNVMIDGTVNASVSTPENSCDLVDACEEGILVLKTGDGQLIHKKRKSKRKSHESGISGEHVHEPQIMVQSCTDSNTMVDGFHWRKYGQKVVKGNLYPRSYYRCTSLKCHVRKHVERASDDPRSFITTYEGKHNHDMPSKKSNAIGT